MGMRPIPVGCILSESPVPDVGRAVDGGTFQRITPVLVAPEVDLPSGESAAADRADSLVVERVPFVRCITFAQKLESIFRYETGSGHSLRDKAPGHAGFPTNLEPRDLSQRSNSRGEYQSRHPPCDRTPLSLAKASI